MASVLLWASAGLVVASAILKAARFDSFEATVDRYALLPRSWSRPLARLTVLVELAGGVLLIFPGAVGLLGVLGTLAVLGAGAAAAIHNLIIGNTEHPCGCFAESAGHLTWLSPIRTLALAAAIVVARTTAEPALRLDEVAIATAATGGFALALLAVLVTRALTVEPVLVSERGGKK